MANALAHDQGGATGTSSPLAITCAFTPTSGNLLIAFISSNRGSSAARTVSSITQTNVVWTKITGSSGANGSVGVEIWRGVVSASPSTSVSIAFSGTIASGASAEILEISGVSTTIDATAVVATATSTSPATGNYTTANANDLVLACVGYAGSVAPSVEPGGSFSNATFKGANTAAIQGNYILVGTKTTYAPTWTITSAAWVAIIVSLQVTLKTQTLTASTQTMSGSHSASHLFSKVMTSSAAQMAAELNKRYPKNLTSPTGGWNLISTPNQASANSGLRKLCWSQDLMIFCAVGATGGTPCFWTSSDGSSWTSHTSQNSNTPPVGICWSHEKSLFVAVGPVGLAGQPLVQTSPDGANWTARTTGVNTAVAWTAVAWSADLSLFVAVSNNATNSTMTSSDGISWTNQATTFTADDIVWCQAQSMFVVISNNSTSTFTSTNGTTWTTHAGALSATTYSYIDWSPTLSLFVAGGNQSSGAHPAASSDAITWNTIDSVRNASFVKWCSALGMFIIAAQSNSYVMVTSTATVGSVTTQALSSSWGSTGLACSDSGIIINANFNNQSNGGNVEQYTPLTGSLSALAGTLIRGRLISAAQALFTAALTTVKSSGSLRFQTLTSSMATMSATINRKISKFFNAQ